MNATTIGTGAIMAICTGLAFVYAGIPAGIAVAFIGGVITLAVHCHDLDAESTDDADAIDNSVG